MDELNRDLLVAVLAVLTDAIPRHALSVALSAWVKDRQKSLAEILLADGSIDPERLQALHCLAESHLLRHQNDLRVSLDAWNAVGLTQEVLTEISDAALTTTLGVAIGPGETLPVGPSADDGLGETIPVPGGPSDGTGEAPAPAGGERFQPIRLHAKGGIGQVWVARDGELQREVALKVIQERFAGREDQRARFVLEAEITGKLEHPGIVPVYSMGRNAAGRPYYAMRFIRGESLASAIRQFHLRWRGRESDGGGSTSMWGVAFRELLGRFLDVCDAIEYAHSRGVLHRDLKPANIMLGRYGETLVVDWGLAKVIGQPDIVPTMGRGDVEPSLAASGTRSTAGDTQPGTTIGTPSYMSPEQARGALDEMGPTSDVYSLGATLYELLTGQVAFKGEKTADVLQRVVKGEFRPPRALLRTVPAPLEAICLKAMALERRGRYDTVRELARDIRHWLADEPVVAYPEGRLERFGRWLRQHRTWTYAAAAALVGITVAASVGMVVVERGRRREREARELAVTNFNLAKKAVEDYFTRVSEDTLLKAQDSVDMRLLRAELLKTALGYYREFLRQRGGDPGLRRELAEAQYRVGQIMREIGTADEAVAAFDASIRIWEDLRAAAPDDPDVRVQLARTCLALGEQFEWIRDFPRAFDALARSRDILKGLQAEKPGDVSYRVALADCDKELGIAEADGGEPDRGLERLVEAESILKGLLSQSPGDFAHRKRLADTINAQGVIHFKNGNDAAALRAFRDFQEKCQSLLDDQRSGPAPVQLLDSLARSYYNVGAILFKQDRTKALESYQKSLEYRLALVQAHQSVHDFHENLAMSLAEISRLQYEAGRVEEAFASIQRSIEVLDKLVAAQRDQPRYHGQLARALNILGFLYDEALRDNVRALPVFERARDEEDRAVTEVPESDLYKLELIEILQNLGEQYADLGTPDAGLTHYRRAVLVRQQLLAARPLDRGRTLTLADQFKLLATVERHAGDSSRAQRSYADAVATLAPLTSAAGAADVEVRRGTLLMGQGVAAADQGRTDEALPLLRRAVEILTPFGSSAKDDPKPRWRLSEALWETARLLRRTGRLDDADLLEAERQALWKDRPPGELADLAMEETTQAARVGYGRLPVGERAAAVRRLDLDLAADHLRLAVARGFRDFDSLRTNRDARLLLLRVDVRRVLDDLEFPDDPFQPASKPEE